MNENENNLTPTMPETEGAGVVGCTALLGTPRTDALIADKEKFCFDASDLEAAMALTGFARELERELNQRNQACDDYAKTIYAQADEIEKLKASGAVPNVQELSQRRLATLPAQRN